MYNKLGDDVKIIYLIIFFKNHHSMLIKMNLVRS